MSITAVKDPRSQADIWQVLAHDGRHPEARHAEGNMRDAVKRKVSSVFVDTLSEAGAGAGANAAEGRLLRGVRVAFSGTIKIPILHWRQG